ncbi:protein kinase [Bacteroidota bacterium]
MIGETISHYKIVEKLGEGGMGIVYKAQDLKLDRFAALKFLPPSLTKNEESKERFILEAKAASALDHNNICAIYEIDETEDRQLFIAMAHYEGESLKQKIDKAPLNIDEAVDIAVQIAEGLAKAHENNIIHRDIKPDNIFITNDGVVKILDFGLAKVVGKSQLTQMGSTYGTIAYMSSEQTTGGKVDNRTDIWSLGVVFYEMLTGQRPFKGEYEHAISYSIVNEIPEAITSLRSEISKELDSIVEKTLKKNPEERYQSTGDFLSDLRAETKSTQKIGSTGESIIAKIPWLKRPYAYIGLLIIIVLMVLYLSNLFTGSSNEIQSIAILPLDNLSGDTEQEYFADGMTDALISELAQISALRVISRTSIMQYKGVKKPLQEIAGELNVDAIVEGTVLYDNDQIRITIQLIQANPEQHLWADDYKRDLRNIFELQEEVAKSIAHEINITVTPDEQIRLTSAGPVDPEVYKLYLKGYHYFDKATQEGYEKSIEYYNQVLEKDPNFAPAHLGMAESYLGMAFRGGFTDDLRSKFDASAQKVLELDDSFSETHHMLAVIKTWVDWDPLVAEKELKRALELNPNSAKAHDLYCNVLILMGRLEEAVTEREKTFELDPLSHVFHCNGGFTYYIARSYDQAIHQAEMTSEQFGPACSSEDLVIGMSYNQKAMYENAISVLEKRISISNNDARLMAELAYAYALSDQRDKAEEILEKLNERGAKRLGRPYYYLSAFIQVAFGNKDEAFRLLEKSFEHKEFLYPWLPTDPRFDAIKSDPRYQQLLEYLDFWSS